MMRQGKRMTANLMRLGQKFLFGRLSLAIILGHISMVTKSTKGVTAPTLPFLLDTDLTRVQLPGENAQSSEETRAILEEFTFYNATQDSLRVGMTNASQVNASKSKDKDVSLFVSTFQQAAKSFVNRQAGTWIRHAGLLNRDYDEDRSSADREGGDAELRETEERCHAPPPASPSIKQNAKLETKKKEDATLSSESRDEKFPSPMLWDSEEDIPKYFENLQEACSRPVGDTNTSLLLFDEHCFGLLRSLIHQPRCTTSFDSTAICSNQPVSRRNTNEGRLMPSSFFGASHFQADSINVIIVGAGPIGLFLASSLMELQKRRTKSYYFPDVRVVVFENRIIEPGQKKMYSRDWMTDLTRGYMDGTLSEMLLGVLDTLFHGDDDHYASITLPVKALETLLLLSNRANGVKFIFDDIVKYREEVRSTPNLIVFDASGHRIQKLDISSLNTERQHHATLWEAETEDEAKDMDGYNIPQERLLDFQENGPGLYIVSSEASAITGSILYPTFEEEHATHGDPYKLYFLKVNLATPLNYISAVYDTFNTRNGAQAPEICYEDDADLSDTTKKDFDDASEGIYPLSFCGPHFSYDSSYRFRDDIYAAWEKGIETFDYDPGFNIRLALLNLSQAQYCFFEHISKNVVECSTKRAAAAETPQRTRAMAANEIPLRCLKREMEQYLQDDTYMNHNKVMEILQHIIGQDEEHQNGNESFWSVFVYRPYIYLDPLAPARMNDYLFGSSRTLATVDEEINNCTDQLLGDDAPVLRVGDSLLSGDPNASTGMDTNMRIIRYFQCLLWGYDDDLCAAPAPI